MARELKTLMARHDWLPRNVHERASSAFSAVSALYDSETEQNPVVAWVRRQTMIRLTNTFRLGDHVIELGCGTGIEAVALGHAGIYVLATDVAPGMIAQTRARVQSADLTDRVEIRHVAAAAIGDLLTDCTPGSFAGAFSSFGPLNCEPDLPAVADALARLIRPGGRVLISAINRFHPFEILWYAAHGDFARATRRWSGYSEGTVSPELPDRVPTFYYTPHAFARAFEPRFRVVDCRALLLFLPPPYLAHLLTRFPRLFRLTESLELSVADWPLLRALGDHFWLELERV